MVNFLQKNTLPALKISLKGLLQSHCLVPFNWTFNDLSNFLPELLCLSKEVLIYRNHQLMDDEDSFLLHTCLKKTYDCHFPEDRVILKLKIDKIVEVDQDTPLPLQLYETF